MTKRDSGASPNLNGRGAPLRVIAVDDDADEFALLKDGFEQLGVDIVWTTSTTAHIALVELQMSGLEDRPQLALVDVNMPAINGFTLAKYFITQGIPTVLMSSQITEERIQEALSIRALNLLVKPSHKQGYLAFAKQVILLNQNNVKIHSRFNS